MSAQNEVAQRYGVAIRRWPEVAADSRYHQEIDAVFFSSSAVTSFTSESERAAFRERWLGRYLEHYPEWALVALDPERRLVGYVAGSGDDPARTPLFSDIQYFAIFATLTARFPAQAHINVAAPWRGRGVGGRLLEHFLGAARRRGVAGAHVVTARGMRNVAFYEAHDFREAGAALWNGKEVVLLARTLDRQRG